MKNNKKLIGSIVILVIFIIFLFTGYIISRPVKESDTEDIFIESNTEKNKDIEYISVYINGEINSPGVYKLKEGDRVQELIKKAGGFTKNSDKLNLNLAKKLRDEDYIYVNNKNDKKNNNCTGNSLSMKNSKDKININIASKEELKTIPGIGDVTAQKIIDYREKNNKFSSLEELKKIDRIGEKTFKKIKDKVDIM